MQFAKARELVRVKLRVAYERHLHVRKRVAAHQGKETRQIGASNDVRHGLRSTSRAGQGRHNVVHSRNRHLLRIGTFGFKADDGVDKHVVPVPAELDNTTLAGVRTTAFRRVHNKHDLSS